MILYVNDRWGGWSQVPWLSCGIEKVILESQFFLSTFTWDPGMEFRSQGLSSKCLCLLSEPSYQSCFLRPNFNT